MKKIDLSDYIIYVGPIADALIQSVQPEKYTAVYILVDEITKKHCLPKVIAHIPKAEVIEITSGEINKNIEVCSFIWRTLVRKQADRKALMINLGGGVIGDMGGFTASTYKRGIDFIQIPTTLLSQVDASIGGKLGIDFDQIKNCIGLFKNPKAILIDPEFLRTLPERQLISGMTEIFKHGLLGDTSIIDRLLSYNSIKNIIDEQLIVDAIAIKRKVVESDPFEQGYRKVLNLGHTIGHAIESFYMDTEEPLLHGEAIAAGLVCELFISQQQLGMETETLAMTEKFVKKWYGTLSIPEENYQDIFHLLLNDKKNEQGRIHFSLLRNIGDPIVNQIVSKERVYQSFDFFNEKAAMSI